MKKSNLSSHKDSTETTSLSKKRVRSLSPLEYAEGILMEREPSPDYSRWVSPLYFVRLQEQLAKVGLGKPPSDEEQARASFGIGWADEAASAKANTLQDFKDSWID